MKLATNTALAKVLGCDEGAVRKAERDGRITRTNGRWDVDLVARQWLVNTSGSHLRRVPPYVAEYARLVAAEAARKRPIAQGYALRDRLCAAEWTAGDEFSEPQMVSMPPLTKADWALLDQFSIRSSGWKDFNDRDGGDAPGYIASKLAIADADVPRLRELLEECVRSHLGELVWRALATLEADDEDDQEDGDQEDDADALHDDGDDAA